VVSPPAPRITRPAQTSAAIVPDPPYDRSGKPGVLRTGRRPRLTPACSPACQANSAATPTATRDANRSFDRSATRAQAATMIATSARATAIPTQPYSWEKSRWE